VERRRGWETRFRGTRTRMCSWWRW